MKINKKKLWNKLKPKRIAITAIGINIIWSVIAYADQVDKISQVLAQYAAKGGGIVAFLGAIFTASGYKSDNPAEMQKGIKTVISGVIIIVIAKGYTAWLS